MQPKTFGRPFRCGMTGKHLATQKRAEPTISPRFGFSLFDTWNHALKGFAMLSLNVTGTLGKYGYSDIPDDIADEIIMIATNQAYMTAVKEAPYDPTPDGINIKTDLKHKFSKSLRAGFVWIQSLYANIAEYGSKHRLPHPYMRPASRAARLKMKQVIRASTRKAIDKKRA